jgi:CO/xanthine dehydrogenase FAD-binding subunit
MLVTDNNHLLADGVTDESAKAFAGYVAEKVPTGSNMRGSAAYRTHLIKVLVERSLNELGGM